MMFKQYEIDFDTIKVGQTAHAMFEAENCKIIEVIPGCPKCTKYSVQGNFISVTYKAEPIPVHLRVLKEYSVKKRLDVVIEDTNDGIRKAVRLYIKGKVIE